MSTDASTASGSNTSTASSVGTATASGTTTITYSSTEIEKELINADLDSDVTLFGDKWSATWIDGMKSVAVFNAIAGEAGKEEARKMYEQLEWSEIPKDFIIDSDKWTKEQLDVRMLEYGHVIFTKLKKASNKVDKEAISLELSQDYKNRCYNLRDMVIGLGKPRGKNVFGLRFNGRFPTYRQNGKMITCIDDFKDAIINEPYHNEMRTMIHYVQNQMWGKGNTYALQIETKVMQLLKLRYVDEYCDLKEEEYPKKKHPGGCIKALLVRLKQSSMVNSVRRLVKDQQCERLYHRNVGLSKDVKCIVRATKKSHGFNGYLGLCVGHPDLDKMLAMQAQETEGAPEPNQQAPVVRKEEPRDMRAWFNEVMANGGVNTPEELLEAIKKDGRPSMVVTDGSGSGKSTMSNLTPLHEDSDATTLTASPQSVPARAIREVHRRKILDKAFAAPATKKLTVHKQKTAQPPVGRKSMSQPSARPRTEVTQSKKANTKKTSKKEAPKKKTTSKKMFDEGFLKSLEDESDSDDEVLKQIPAPLKSSPRKKRTSDQIEKDLINKPKAVCNHTAKNQLLSGYSALDQQYYTKTYLKKMETEQIPFPFSCGLCKAAFVTGKGATEKDYKVTSTKVVRCCPNAYQKDHECEFGLCDCCYLGLLKKADEEQQKTTAPRASARGLVKRNKNKRANNGAQK